MALVRSSSLNLWDVETKTNSKFDIDVTQAVVNVTTTGGQSLKLNPVVHLSDDTNGDISNLSQKIYDLDAAIASGTAGSAAAAALVQANLETFASDINTSIGGLSVSISNEAAQRAAAQNADAVARATLNTALNARINAVESKSNSDDAAIVATQVGESARIDGDVAAEAATRATEDAAVVALVNVEKGRIDSILSGSDVNLNQLTELITAYEGADTTITDQISLMLADLTELTQRVDELTDSSSVVPRTTITYVNTGLFSITGSPTNTLTIQATNMANASYVVQIGDTVFMDDSSGFEWSFAIASIGGSTSNRTWVIDTTTSTRAGVLTNTLTSFANYGANVSLKDTFTAQYQ